MKEKTIFWVLLGLLIVIRLLFPGDVPWINDESILIYNAFISNHHNAYPVYGLIGSMGIPYGPLPIWIYKFLLSFSQDLILIVLLKTSISVLISFLSLYFIAKTLKLTPFPLLIPFVSPYIFFYDRLLWDNCFLIPASSILLLSLVKFIDTHRLFWFAISLYTIVCLVHIHLMSLLIVIPFFIYLALFEREWLSKHWKNSLLVLAVFLCFLIPYSIIISSSTVAGTKIPTGNSWYNWFNPVRFFSFWGFDHYFVPEMLTKNTGIHGRIYTLLRFLSGIGFVFFITGFIKIFTILWTKSLKKIELTTEEKFLSYCTITVLSSILWFTISRIAVHPHYNNAICLVYLFFIYFYLNLYWKNKIIRCFFWVYFVSMLLLLISFSYFIHSSGGTRTDHYGTTLKDQINIIKQINSYDPKIPIYVDVDNFNKYPHSFQVLQFLYNKPEGPKKDGPIKRINVVYRDKNSTGWIALDTSSPTK